MMRAVFKEDAITSSSFEEARGIVSSGLSSLLNEAPATSVIALVLAKITLESGRSGTILFTSCHQGNVGNIKAAPDYEGMFTLYACNEVLSGEVVWFAPGGRLDKKGGVVVSEHYPVPPAGDGHPQCRFRAYANLVDGIYEYLDFIWREKYRDAREALLTGDPHAYVHALKVLHYFTADETVYGRGVTALHAEFLKRLRGENPPPEPTPSLDGLRAAQPFNLRSAQAVLDAAFAGREEEVVMESFAADNGDDDEVTVPGRPVA